MIEPRRVNILEPKLFSKFKENETRTRDPNLGKVMLYQLSYFRIFKRVVFVWDCKGTKNF